MAGEYHKHDIIIPLAAIVGAPACKRQPEATKAIHVDTVRDMVKQLSKDQIVLYPVTNSGYGIGEAGKMCTEESPCAPSRFTERPRSKRSAFFWIADKQ